MKLSVTGKTMKFLSRAIITVTLILFLSPMESFAMMHGPGPHMGPYGGYCRGPKWGWYGARRQVKTEKEVRELVTDFLSDTGLIPGEISDRGTYFEVEIRDGAGEVVDLLIVDKATCRMRSAY